MYFQQYMFLLCMIPSCVLHDRKLQVKTIYLLYFIHIKKIHLATYFRNVWVQSEGWGSLHRKLPSNTLNWNRVWSSTGHVWKLFLKKGLPREWHRPVQIKPKLIKIFIFCFLRLLLSTAMSFLEIWHISNLLPDIPVFYLKMP